MPMERAGPTSHPADNLPRAIPQGLRTLGYWTLRRDRLEMARNVISVKFAAGRVATQQPIPIVSGEQEP